MMVLMAGLDSPRLTPRWGLGTMPPLKRFGPQDGTKTLASGAKSSIKNLGLPMSTNARLTGAVHVGRRLPSWRNAIRIPMATTLSLRKAHSPTAT